MDANQLIKSVGEAVVNTKPAQEYCLFWSDWWPLCMTKSEWSGWMQFFGAISALIIAIAIPFFQNLANRRNNLKMARQCLLHQSGAITALIMTIEHQDLKNSVYAAKETLNTAYRSFEMVNSTLLPHEILPTWFAAITSAEQLKNFANGIFESSLQVDEIRGILESYQKNQYYYLSEFNMHNK